MPLLKMDFISSVLALAEPVPFTVAILIVKSLTRWVTGVSERLSDCSGDLGLARFQHPGFVLRVRPMDVGLLHVPCGRGATLGAEAAVHAEVLVLDHDARRL